jgi:hypothetical protein
MEMLCGTFDNRDQLLRESLAGLPVHPGARHTIGICNDKIDDLPEDFNGYFVIEESRFDLEDQCIEKHYLFLYDEDEQGCVRLTSYNIPEEIPKESFTNDNPSLHADYLKLEVSPRFLPLTLRENDGAFFGENCSRFSGDTTFLFSLSVSAERLLVKELLLRGAERVAGYEEPVEYVRIQD